MKPLLIPNANSAIAKTRADRFPIFLFSKHNVQGFHKVFAQEVSGVLQPGTSSFTYERKYEEQTKTARQIDG